MSIRFACESCGHPFEVDDRLGGHLMRCKHCGHEAAIPGGPGANPGHARAPVSEPAAPGLKLRPLEVGEADAAEHVPAPPASLSVRPVEPGHAHSPLPDELHADDLDDDPSRRRKKARDKPIKVLDPEGWERVQSRGRRLNPHYETRAARFAARMFRSTRDGLYVASLALLVLVLLGFLFHVRALMHLGAVGVVAVNVGMLAAGVFYLVTLPFKDSLAKGLGTLLVPPYAVYYWATNWGRMRRPVVNTAASFAPILLVGLAYVLYTEAPVIEREAGRIERTIEAEGKAIEGKFSTPETPTDAEPTPEPPAGKAGPPPY